MLGGSLFIFSDNILFQEAAGTQGTLSTLHLASYGLGVPYIRRQPGPEPEPHNPRYLKRSGGAPQHIQRGER